MAGRSLAASSKRLVCASSTMKTVGSLASIASDIAIILCIVGLCNLIGSNPCPTSSHRSLAVNNGVGWEKLVGTPRAHTHKTTQNTPSSYPQCACGKASPPRGRVAGHIARCNVISCWAILPAATLSVAGPYRPLRRYQSLGHIARCNIIKSHCHLLTPWSCCLGESANSVEEAILPDTTSTSSVVDTKILLRKHNSCTHYYPVDGAG